MRGRFITFEGGEGVGKSTQVERLKRRLEKANIPVIATREPGGTARAERIRNAVLSGGGAPYGALAEALLFSAARLDNLRAIIRPALEDGKVVLCDRFFDSTRVYQGLDPKMDVRLLDTLERITLDGIRPDLTIVLDLPVDAGMTRAAARRAEGITAPDRFEREEILFHEKLRRGFLAVAAGEPERCTVIAADLSPDRIEEQVWRLVEARLFGAAANAAFTTDVG